MAKVTCYYKVVEFEDVFGNKVRTTNIFGHPAAKPFKVVYDSIDDIPEIPKNKKGFTIIESKWKRLREEFPGIYVPGVSFTRSTIAVPFETVAL